jgi:hypothetical protein
MTAAVTDRTTRKGLFALKFLEDASGLAAAAGLSSSAYSDDEIEEAPFVVYSGPSPDHAQLRLQSSSLSTEQDVWMLTGGMECSGTLGTQGLNMGNSYFSAPCRAGALLSREAAEAETTQGSVVGGSIFPAPVDLGCVAIFHRVGRNEGSDYAPTAYFEALRRRLRDIPIVAFARGIDAITNAEVVTRGEPERGLATLNYRTHLRPGWITEGSTPLASRQGRARATTVGLGAPQRNDSPLASAIQQESETSEVDEEFRQAAATAVRQAMEFVCRQIPDGRPMVSVTDSGRVVLHWRGSDVGLLLIFTDEQVAYYSIKRAGGFFGTHEVSFCLDMPLPQEARAVLKSLGA